MTDPTASYDQNMEAARLAHGRGDRAGTEQALLSAIRAAELMADGHLKLVASLIKLGELKHADGKSDEAEAQFQRALEIGERILGENDLALVPPLTSLGALRIARGAPEAAEPLLTRALAISERNLGRDHPDLVVLLNDLSRHYLKQSAYAFAEPLLLQLYSIKRSKGEDHPEVATVLASLAAVRQALGRHDAAEQLWRRVLDIRERTLAPNHFATATALEHLAETCAARGKFAEALALFQRALAMRELTLGASHPSLRVSRERIADLQLQGSEESFELGVAQPLLGLGDWALPTASDPSLSAPEPREPARPVVERAPVPPSPRLADEAFPAIKPADATPAAPIIRAPAASPIAAKTTEARPASTYTPPPAPTPAARPATSTIAAPAAATQAPPQRPTFTPESDARPMAARTLEPRLDSAPEAFAEDDDAPSGLRLFAVGNQGQTGSALVMPSFAGDLAVIEQELAQQDSDARTAATTSLAAAAATFVRTRPVPIIAFGLGAAALALLTWGPGTTSGDDTLPIARPAQTQPAPIVAPVLDSAAGSVSAGTATETPATDRSASAERTSSPTSDHGNASSSDSRSGSKSVAAEKTPSSTVTPAPTRPGPDLSRPLPNVANAQLDEAMRVAGQSSSSTSDAITKPSVTFSSGVLTSSAAALPGAAAAQNTTQPALIGSMPQIAYPQALRAGGRTIPGQVLVEFSVDTLGRPDIYTVNILKSDHELFAAAVRMAIPSMRFVPATLNGKKVRGVVTTQFRFGMDKSQDNQR